MSARRLRACLALALSCAFAQAQEEPEAPQEIPRFQWSASLGGQASNVRGNEEVFRSHSGFAHVLGRLTFKVDAGDSGWLDEFRFEFSRPAAGEQSRTTVTAYRRSVYRWEVYDRRERDYSAVAVTDRSRTGASLLIFPTHPVEMSLGYERQSVEKEGSRTFYNASEIFPLRFLNRWEATMVRGGLSVRLGKFSAELSHVRADGTGTDTSELAPAGSAGTGRPNLSTLLFFDGVLSRELRSDRSRAVVRIAGSVLDLEAEYVRDGQSGPFSGTSDLSGTTVGGAPRSRHASVEGEASSDWRQAELRGRWKVSDLATLVFVLEGARHAAAGRGETKATTFVLGVPFRTIVTARRGTTDRESAGGLQVTLTPWKSWRFEAGGRLLEREVEIDWDDAGGVRRDRFGQRGEELSLDAAYRSSGFSAGARVKRRTLDRGYTPAGPTRRTAIEGEARYRFENGVYVGASANASSERGGSTRPFFYDPTDQKYRARSVAANAGYRGGEGEVEVNGSHVIERQRSHSELGNPSVLLPDPRILSYDAENATSHVDAAVRLSSRVRAALLAERIAARESASNTLDRGRLGLRWKLNPTTELEVSAFARRYRNGLAPDEDYRSNGAAAMLTLHPGKPKQKPKP